MPKRGENIYRRKDGRWEGRFIKNHINGKAKYGYVFAHSYKEVKEKLLKAKEQHQVNGNNTISDPKPNLFSFEQASNEWLYVNAAQWKKSSYVKYVNILNNYLIPEFGNKEIENISRNDVMEFIANLLLEGGNKKQGLSSKTVNNTISVMKNIFQYVKANNNLSLIDFKGLYAKPCSKPMRILSNSEQALLTKYLVESLDEVSLGILLSLYTGIRIGELCALRWEDIIFDDKCIHISKTMQRLQSLDKTNQKTEVIITEPKSHSSIRDIPIPDALLKILLAYRKAPNTYFLTGIGNRYIEPRTMQNRFKTIIKDANIAPANFHALRHTFATRCIELGFDIKSLSEILGHASVNITLNRYVHPSMELKQKNMDMLSDLLAVK